MRASRRRHAGCRLRPQVLHFAQREHHLHREPTPGYRRSPRCRQPGAV